MVTTGHILTKVKVNDDKIDRVESGEKISRISFSVNGLDVAENKLTGHYLNSYS